MNILLSDDEIIQKIKMYPVPNWIWIEIWEMSQYEIQVVITVNKEEMCHLADHIVIHTCSAQTDNENDIIELKTYGGLIVKLIRKNFPNSNVHSRLYYR
jgi:hypothetical protein